MKHQSLRTILTGGALVVALTLAGSTPAHAASGPAGGLWSWLTGLWGPRIAAPWTGTGRAHGARHSGTAPGWEKAGGCADPNGGCVVPGTPESVPGSGSDAGAALNPQG
ncbi:MAG TPA: hypothetical protein VIJ26_01720 [Thermoanaerobaculia bacterium]